MITEEIHVIEATYVLEKLKMVTFWVTVSDYELEEDLIAPPEQQCQDERLCVLAKPHKATHYICIFVTPNGGFFCLHWGWEDAPFHPALFWHDICNHL